MRSVLFVCVILPAMLVTNFTTAQERFEVPVVFRNDYGPLKVRGGTSIHMRPLTEIPTGEFPEVRGLPGEWTDVKLGIIETDPLQLVYQDMLRGNKSRRYFRRTLDFALWRADTTRLTTSCVKCFVMIAKGRTGRRDPCGYRHQQQL